MSNFSFYDLLGLKNSGASADDETMKKAYHKAVLLYHPDKKANKSTNEEEDRQVFLKIQEAYATLTNETKRRAYDSQLDFDDSVPTEKEDIKALKKGTAGFVKLYAPVFQRNARFAVIKPVPDLGDEETPIEDVYAFYDYWVNFESWRDFSTVGVEHKPDNAGSREEKRFMIKENDRISKKNKKNEMTRINDLVLRAMQIDPRVVADKESKKKAKEAVKNAREAETKKRELEFESAKKYFEDEDAAALEKMKNSKAEKEKLKKAQSKGRNILRKLIRASADVTSQPFSDDEIEVLCSGLDMVDLNIVNDAMGGEPATKSTTLLTPVGLDVARKYLEDSKKTKEQLLEEKKEEKKIAMENVNKDTNKKRGVDYVWTTDENTMLSKAITTYPAGTRQRFQSICNFMNEKLRPVVHYSEEECIRAAYNLVKS